MLDASGHQLMVHPIPPRIARTIAITEPPKRRISAVVKMVFAVKSIANVRARAPALGGALQPPEKMFEARGFRACDGHDPEGNIIQFREIAGAPVRRPAQKKSRKGDVDHAVLRDVALALPDVKASSTMRGITFKARGKLLACKATHRSAEPDSLVVRVDPADRDRLLVAEPQTYYLTPHYLSIQWCWCGCRSSTARHCSHCSKRRGDLSRASGLPADAKPPSTRRSPRCFGT